MSDVLGTGAYGDPANPALTRQAYDELHGVTEDDAPASDDAPAEPAPDAAPTPMPTPMPAPAPAPTPDETKN